MAEQQDKAIQQQATDWVVKLDTGDMGAGDEDRFVAWLEQDERHGIAMHEAEKAWQLMQEQPQPSSRLRILLPLAATLLLTLFSSLFWWQDVYFAINSDHYTFTGERKTLQLEDGSTLVLNTDTAVTVDFSSTQRRVTVLRGEVYSVVSPDAAKPFVVAAGDLRVTALGTEFIVTHLRDGMPTVSVTEHSVKVENAQSAATKAILQAGQQVSLLEARDTLTVIEQINTHQVQAWRNGKYVFEDQRFADVITELNRYYTGKIIVRGDSLKDMRISGVLNTDEPIGSLTQLSQSLSLEIGEITPLLVVIEKT